MSLGFLVSKSRLKVGEFALSRVKTTTPLALDVDHKTRANLQISFRVQTKEITTECSQRLNN